MTDVDKKEILKDVATALENVNYGKITIELRETAKYTDVVVEHRKRHTHTLNKSSV